MKRLYTFFLSMAIMSITYNASAQAILLDDNHSLEGFPFNGKIFLKSDRDSTFWTSDGTPGGTSQISTVKVDDNGAGILNNTIYFAGLSAIEGSELWKTDGTGAHTSLVADIWAGIGSSEPTDFFAFNNKLYFTAYTPTNGRELYEYSGSESPTRVTDLNPGAGNAFDIDAAPTIYFHNNIVYFDATDGTNMALYTLKTSGVSKLMDIPSDFEFEDFSQYAHVGNTVYFYLTNSDNTVNLYKTNGTPSGTSLVRAFTGDFASYSFQMIPFNNKLLLSVADAGTNTELWSTDGTTTQMVKDINPGPNGSNPFLLNAVIFNNKLFFMASTDASGAELWSTDGTEPNTAMLIDINTNPGEGSYPVLWPVFRSIDYSDPGFQSMDFYDRSANYNGYIFFSANDDNNNAQLWKTNGTAAGTELVKILNPSDDGVSGSYIYTTSGIVFGGDDGTNGIEPWISNGTAGGTTPIANINTNPPPDGDSDPGFLFIWKGDIYLEADNGNSGFDGFTDFYKLQGPYFAMPVSLINFDAQVRNTSVQLSWSTATESNSDHFDVERSTDGVNFTSIGQVTASGNSNDVKTYGYTDDKAYNLGKTQLYYRLHLVDKDGRTAYSKVAPVMLTGSPVAFKIFPNPVHDELKVQYSTLAKSTISITGMNGKQLYQATLDANSHGIHRVNVSNYPAGTFILKFVNEGKVSIQKFIKE